MKRYIIVAILLCCNPAYTQLSNQLNKTVDGIATVRNASTLLDSLFFTSKYSQAIFDIIASLQQYGFQAGNYSDLAAGVTAASADTASLIISERHNITTNTTISGMLDVVVLGGGRINITSGDTLTFADSVNFDAGNFQVFEGSGQVRGLRNVKVSWFGVKGNGSTDDATNLQKALDSFKQGTIEFDAGTFIIGTALDFAETDSNITMLGNGTSTILKIKDSVDLVSMFTWTNIRHVTVKNLTFDTNQVNQTAGQDKAMSFSGCTDVRILDCTFIGGNSTTGSPESVNLLNTDVFIFKGNTSIDEENFWVIMDNVDNFVISGNISSASCDDTSSTPFNIRDFSSNGVIFGNVINCGGGSGIFLDDPSNGGDAPEKFAITGNVIANTFGDAILAEQAPFTVVTGNVIFGDHPSKGGDSGISLGSIGNLAVGNLIVGKNNVGISLFHDGKTDQSKNAKLAVGNIILDTGTGNPGVESRQIWLDDQIHILVVGNLTFSGNTPNNTNYGIRETGTSEDNLILGNLTYRDSTAGVSLISSESTNAFNMITKTATTVDSNLVIADNMHLGAFKLKGDIDPDTFGGFKDVLWFQLTNVPGNTTTSILPYGSPVGHTGYQMQLPGSIIGVTYRTTAALSAGTMEINILVEAVDTGFGLSLTTSEGIGVSATQAKDTDTWNSNQRILVEAVTDASFAPTSMDIIVGVMVEY